MPPEGSPLYLVMAGVAFLLFVMVKPKKKKPERQGVIYVMPMMHSMEIKEKKKSPWVGWVFVCAAGYVLWRIYGKG